MMATAEATLPFSPARTQSFLRSTNIPSPVLLEAMRTRPFNIQPTNDPLVFRELRAKHLAALRHLMPLAGQPISEEVGERDVYVTVRDGAEVRVRVYTPLNSSTTLDAKAGAGAAAMKVEEGKSANTGEEGNSEGRPLVLMFHEGGWQYGDLTDEEMNCRLFARDLDCVVGNVEYR